MEQPRTVGTAQAWASTVTPVPLTAVAAASSVSAPSTSVQAAALTTTSCPATGGADRVRGR